MLNSESKVFNSSNTSILETLENIKSKDLKFKSNKIDYFFEVAKNYMHQEKENNVKRVGIIGLNIPEELIIACGAKPVWVLGGSFDYASYADPMVARDTDPIVKSLLGMLSDKSNPFFSEIDLLVIPLISDSMRKVAHMLSKDFDTFVVDIPPVKERQSSYVKWRQQLEEMTKKICALTGKKLKNKDLILASRIIMAAKIQIQIFIKNHQNNPNLLSANLYVLILNSYFMTDNLEDWTIHLDSLNQEIQNISKVKLTKIQLEEYKPNILLLGSSIFFPNMKIPTLFDDSGLNLYDFEVEMLSYLHTIPDLRKSSIKNNIFANIFANICDEYYKNDISQAFTNNKTKINALKNSNVSSNIDGVVYHVIRGQVSCDFEFQSLEDYFIEQDIPIQRIETDYNYQDIEQLRIRLEAFAEITKARCNYIDVYKYLQLQNR